MKGWKNSNSPQKSLIRDLSNENENPPATRAQPPRPYRESHVSQTPQLVTRLPLHAPKALGQRGERKSMVHACGSSTGTINSHVTTQLDLAVKSPRSRTPPGLTPRSPAVRGGWVAEIGPRKTEDAGGGDRCSGAAHGPVDDAISRLSVCR